MLVASPIENLSRHLAKLLGSVRRPATREELWTSSSFLPRKVMPLDGTLGMGPPESQAVLPAGNTVVIGWLWERCTTKTRQKV